ncbi:MAG: protein phosphatase/kinase family protein [Proteobacteria bacterium]|nr:protein phosphatase/kinase family protein [Pseudomonadota bacterium]
MSEGRLSVQAGFSSLQGRREDNQDFGTYTQPLDHDLYIHGMVAAVADGVGGMKGGRVAAETCARSFIEAYYESPETLGPERAAAKSLAAINEWIHSVGQRDASLSGMATTFSAIILRRRHAHLIHVGDSRIYRLRGGSLEKLTTDHTFKHPDLDHVLCRAVGIEGALCADSATYSLEAHDRYLLCSDGLHATLRESEIRRLLLERASPESTAQTLTRLALQQGSQDNITALVLDVIALPPPDRDALTTAMNVLPLLDIPSVGERVDDFVLDALISKGRYSSLFLAQDEETQRQVVLKFPTPHVLSAEEYYSAFLREAWIGTRVRSPWVAEVVELSPGRQSRLYTVLPYYRGKTLEQKLPDIHSIGLTAGIEIALQLCKAVHALHRLRIIHRDIKPDNILLPDEGGLRLLDLGVARLPAWAEPADAPIPGTASYMAPEEFKGERGSEATDVFAVGVTLFRMFSGGAYPYGEIEPFSTPRYSSRSRKSLSRYRPDLPAWLDAVLARALAVDPAQRYGDITELAYDLESGMSGGEPVRTHRQSWLERNPLLFWKTIALTLLIALLGTLAQLHSGRGPDPGHLSSGEVQPGRTVRANP